MKIVINTCYGGFGLSNAAILRYAEIKGITLYPDQDDFSKTYYLVTEDKRENQDNFMSWSLEERVASNKRANAQKFNISDRSDPLLVQVVEELGKLAADSYAELSIIEIPDGVDWEIKEYDGKEWVAEAHRTWG